MTGTIEFNAAMEVTERSEFVTDLPTDVIFAPNSDYQYGALGGPEWEGSTFTEIYVTYASGWRYEIVPAVLPDYWRVDVRILPPDGSETITFTVEVEDEDVWCIIDRNEEAAIEKVGKLVAYSLRKSVKETA